MDQTALEQLTEKLTARLFVPLEASGRHVHITGSQARQLFGHSLTPERPLSQPGQFLARERLTVAGPKGQLQNVAVLGPERKEAQVEVSLTDARVLGITPPLRESGDVAGSPGLTLRGNAGTLELQQGAIIAKRHIHLDPESAARFGVKDRQTVSLQTFTRRPALLQDVLIRVRQDFAPAVHLDYDEANGCGMEAGDLGRIIP